MHRGRCLCGDVSYEIKGALEPPVACHCSQCARTSGSFAIMAAFATTDLAITNAGTLTWFASSSTVRRGFCQRCGSNLFWMTEGDQKGYVTTGTLDQPTGLSLAEHIFVGSKSDVYALNDDLPKKPEW